MNSSPQPRPAASRNQIRLPVDASATSAEWDCDADYALVYESLITQRERTVAELARRLSTDEHAALSALRILERRGLAAPINPDQGTWEALPPAAFINRRLAHLEQTLADERTRFTDVLEEFWKARSRTITSYAEVEAIREHREIVRTFYDIQTMARQQVRGINRPPYVVPPNSGDDQAGHDIQARRMAEGVDYRILYETSILANADSIGGALAAIAHGEQARTLTRLPMKMVAADDRAAIVILDPPKHHDDPRALLVQRSGLLTALLNTFESLWEASTPMSARSTQTLDKIDRTILAMMVAGSTDEAIGSAVGMSRRTVARRCAALFARLGATNKFQAGAQAVRRGWI